MQASNRAEYELLRQEMQSIRDCVTNYMGFVLAGGGAAQVVAPFLASNPANRTLVAFGSMGIACIIALVLIVLLYKFNSHNRYAGYCKLLAQEQYRLRGRREDSLHAWEVCIDRLREYSSTRRDKARGVPVAHIGGLSEAAIAQKRRDYLGPAPAADRRALRGGIRVLFTTFVLYRSAASWAFPVFVVGVFLVLTVLFLATSVGYAYSVIVELPHWYQSDLPWVLLLMLAFLLLAWIRGICVLHRVMEGTSSVMAFCWRFAFIRSAFLPDAYGAKNYRLVGVSSESRG